MESNKIENMVQKESEHIKEVILPRTIHLVPLDQLDGYDVRPGFYEINGATAIPGGVNFTVHSHGATSIELLLFHREEEKPYAVLPFPQHYRIGNVYSMIVYIMILGGQNHIGKDFSFRDGIRTGITEKKFGM